MLVAFSFSSMTCFRMTREDLMASFSVMDWKTNGSWITWWRLRTWPLSLPSPKSLEAGSEWSSFSRDLQHPQEPGAGRAGISTGTVKSCLSEI